MGSWLRKHQSTRQTMEVGGNLSLILGIKANNPLCLIPSKGQSATTKQFLKAVAQQRGYMIVCTTITKMTSPFSHQSL